jgi:Do/DeqQ family serine protease
MLRFKALFLFILFIAMPQSATAQMQLRVTPESKAATQLSFAPIVKQATPAVVNVFAARVRQNPQNPYMDEFFRRFFGEGGGQGMPQERVQRSVGSGVLVDASGLVVTNNHVIEGMTDVRIAFADRREFEADIVLRDPRTDLAVLRLKGAANLQPLQFGDSEGLQVGDLVLAIGNPFGVGQTVTQGIVSALARTQVGVSDYQFFIQTDAAINPGNSGGALVDMQGRLIGINTAIFSRSGGSHGIGFAIPSSMVRAVVESARGGSAVVRRPWLGARLQVVTPEVAETLGLDRPTGVLVASIVDKSPASEAGLRRSDVILMVDGQTIDDPEAFGYRFALKGLSGQTSLTVLRGKKRLTVSVQLQPPPETRPRDVIKLNNRSPFSGVSVLNLSPAVADELQFDMTSEGVVVADVAPRSPAMQVGFQKGDLVLAINGTRITSSRDVERITNDYARLWRITISRNGQIFTSVFGE